MAETKPEIKESSEPLPQKVPQTLPELERAIMLLGSLIKVGLKDKGKEELTQLLGACPQSKRAPAWKTHLSRLRRERVEGTAKPET
jgi:hypothetical protein